MAEKKQRINNVTAGLMIAVALIFDLLSMIPFVNTITAILGSATFWLWFIFRGVSFRTNPRRALVFGGGLLLELMPFLSWLPALTASVVSTIIMVKWEDKRR